MNAYTQQSDNNFCNIIELKKLRKENEELKKELEDWYIYKCQLEKNQIIKEAHQGDIMNTNLEIEELKHKVKFLEDLNLVYKNENKILEEALTKKDDEIIVQPQIEKKNEVILTDILNIPQKKEVSLTSPKKMNKKLSNTAKTSLKKINKGSSLENKKWK